MMVQLQGFSGSILGQQLSQWQYLELEVILWFFHIIITPEWGSTGKSMQLLLPCSDLPWSAQGCWPLQFRTLWPREHRIIRITYNPVGLFIFSKKSTFHLGVDEKYRLFPLRIFIHLSIWVFQLRDWREIGHATLGKGRQMQFKVKGSRVG